MLTWITTAAIQGRSRKKKRKQACSFMRKEKEGSEGGRTLPTLIGKYQIFSSEPGSTKEPSADEPVLAKKLYQLPE